MEKNEGDGGTKSRQIDQGNERPEESMFLCLLGTCHPKIQLLEMLDP